MKEGELKENMPRWEHGDQLGSTHPLIKLYDSIPSNLKLFLRKFLDKTGLNAPLSLYFDSALRRRGWFESFNNRPIDQDGNPLPWMSYPFIDFASERLTSSMRVFEYGSGSSTIWFANKVGQVTAVEHDLEWYKFVSQDLPSNSKVALKSKAEYAASIESDGLFDVVVIDGIRRVESTRYAIASLTDRGVIVFDDAHRDQYSEATELLSDQNFKRIAFNGMGPFDQKLQTTTIYYRDENCFGI